MEHALSYNNLLTLSNARFKEIISDEGLDISSFLSVINTMDFEAYGIM